MHCWTPSSLVDLNRSLVHNVIGHVRMDCQVLNRCRIGCRAGSCSSKTRSHVLFATITCYSRVGHPATQAGQLCRPHTLVPRASREDPGFPATPARPFSSASSTSSQRELSYVAQLLVLAVALVGLILVPAKLSGRLAPEAGWALANYLTYLLFFASGTIARMTAHGQLAPRERDAQVRTSRSRLAFLLFMAAVPAGHYLAWWLGPSWHRLSATAEWLLRAAGYTMMSVSCWLHSVAAAELGQAFDRLVTPGSLVTSGVYASVQHPIYTSYMLLFCGHCLSLGSPLAAALLLAACLAYYSVRTGIEEKLLKAEFGQQYEEYHRRVGRFLPRLPLAG